MNGTKHGEATQPGLFWESMVELGEDPPQFEVLLTGLMCSLRPGGTTEMMLVSDEATLAWKQARLKRAQHGARECDIEKLELEQERRPFDQGRESVGSAHAEVMRCGHRSRSSGRRPSPVSNVSTSSPGASSVK